jgi:sirohydrochlorin ferrochelatase
MNFLNSGRHVTEDIPRIVKAAEHKYPRVKIRVTACLSASDKIMDLYQDLL